MVCLAVALWFATVTHAQERFDTLRVGVITYSNVMILNKTPIDLFITHAQGLSNIKVRDLDADVAGQLGYGGGATPSNRPRLALPKLELIPEVNQLQELNDDLAGRVTTLPPAYLAGYVTGLIIAYLFSCFCCKLICDKAGAPSKALVWLPGLQIFALFRAAKMPAWLALGMLGPAWSVAAFIFTPKPLNLHDPKTMILLGAGLVCLVIPFLLLVVWCFRIAQAREKSGLIGLALLFPPTSFLTFLYLAFSEGNAPVEPAPKPRPNYVTFS